MLTQEYYKSGMIRCPPSVTVRELREACDYLLIPFDANTVKCQNLSKPHHPDYTIYTVQLQNFQRAKWNVNNEYHVMKFMNRILQI